MRRAEKTAETGRISDAALDPGGAAGNEEPLLNFEERNGRRGGDRRDDGGNERGRQGRNNEPDDGRGQGPAGRRDGEEVTLLEPRPIDGAGANPEQADWGASGQTLLRLGEANYADGIGAVSEDLPNAREISNAVVQQEGDEPSSFGLSDLFWAWGQFLDHDIDLTEAGETEFTPVAVPEGDPAFDPAGEGDAFIPFFRVDPVEGTGETTPREFENEITAFIDASMVYGSDEETAESPARRGR